MLRTLSGLRRPARVVAATAVGLVLLLPGTASAQQGQPSAPRARDGRSLNDEALGTRVLFAGAYGTNAAAQWQREHNVAIRTDLPQAADGLTLQSQPGDVRAAFIAAYGGDAPAKWAASHSGAIGRAVILSDNLEEAVDAAHQ